MTLGELAKMYNAEQRIGAELTVVPVEGWRRGTWWDQTGLPWVNPSPNIRRLEAAIHYPGTVFFEAINVSEGRRTDLPFEQIGAPWLKNTEVVAAMNAMRLAGIRFETVAFRVAESANKYPGQLLNGVRFILTDRDAYRPLATSLLMIDLIRRLHPDQFQWTRAKRRDPNMLTIERHGGGEGAQRENDEMGVPRRIWLLDSLAVVGSLACGPVGATSPAGHRPPTDTLRLENRAIRFGFDPSNGSLLEFTDRATGQSFVDGRAEAGNTAGIWRLDRLGWGDSVLVPSA